MKIAVLLSGGVDSSVALKGYLKDQGHDITLFTLKSGLKMNCLFWGIALGRRYAVRSGNMR